MKLLKWGEKIYPTLCKVDERETLYILNGERYEKGLSEGGKMLAPKNRYRWEWETIMAASLKWTVVWGKEKHLMAASFAMTLTQ